MKGLQSLVSSYRAWAAFISIVVIIAVYAGMNEEVANEIAQNVLIIVGILLGSSTVRKHVE